MYFQTVTLLADTANSTPILTLPADAPTGVYEVAFGMANLPGTITAYNQGTGSTRPETILFLEQANMPMLDQSLGLGFEIVPWVYSKATGTSTFTLGSGAKVGRLSAFFLHTKGEETQLVSRASSAGQFVAGGLTSRVIIKQLA